MSLLLSCRGVRYYIIIHFWIVANKCNDPICYTDLPTMRSFCRETAESSIMGWPDQSEIACYWPGKMYTTVVRLRMLYRADTWATTILQEARRLEVNEVRMLMWICGVTRRDEIRNEHIGGTKRVAQRSKKITEKRLKLYGI